MPTSLEEVLKLDITYSAEYGDSYCFQPQSDDKFDHCMLVWLYIKAVEPYNFIGAWRRRFP